MTNSIAVFPMLSLASKRKVQDFQKQLRNFEHECASLVKILSANQSYVLDPISAFVEWASRKGLLTEDEREVLSCQGLRSDYWEEFFYLEIDNTVVFQLKKSNEIIKRISSGMSLGNTHVKN